MKTEKVEPSFKGLFELNIGNIEQTGKTESPIKKKDGQCVVNCKSDTGRGCTDRVLPVRAERGQAERCVSCPVGRYKAKPGEGKCNASDKALFAGSVECRCNTGYYRGLADSKVCFDDLISV